MKFVELEGTLAELQSLVGIAGLEGPGGHRDVGGGRRRATGIIHDDAAIAEIERRGVTVRVTMDDDEVERRIEADMAMMRDIPEFPDDDNADN